MAGLTEHDFESPSACRISVELVEPDGLFGVETTDGAQLSGRNGSGTYAGLAIPRVLPRQFMVSPRPAAFVTVNSKPFQGWSV